VVPKVFVKVLDRHFSARFLNKKNVKNIFKG